MKRLLALFTLVLVLVAFSACGNDQAKSATGTSNREETAGKADNQSSPEDNGATVRKSADEAKGIAFTHAGLTETEVYDLDVDLDKANGREIYEVDFEKDGAEYEYDIDAYTGEIISAVKYKENSLNTNSEAPMLTEAEAKEIAFKDAGVTEQEVRVTEVELDLDDGAVSYEIDFRIERTEYNYDIDAYSGEILKSEKEID